MSARSDLLAAARQLVIAVGGATDGKVIHAGASGPRPAKPYVTVRLLTPGGGTHGPAERVDSLDEDDIPQVRMRERREATVSFQGYGTDSGAWLDALQLGLDSPASLSEQAELGVSAVLLSPVTDLSAMLDTAEETRFSFELILRHRYESTPAEAVELLTAEVTGNAEIYDGSPNPLPVDQTVTL